MLLPAEQSHVGMRGRRYHLITGQVETVCQNRCPILTDALRIRQCSDLLCEVEPSGSRAILLPTYYLGQCSLWLIFVINVIHFIGVEVGQLASRAKLRERVNRHSAALSTAFRELIGIEQRSHHSIYTIYTLFE